MEAYSNSEIIIGNIEEELEEGESVYLLRYEEIRANGNEIISASHYDFLTRQ